MLHEKAKAKAKYVRNAYFTRSSTYQHINAFDQLSVVNFEGHDHQETSDLMLQK